MDKLIITVAPNGSVARKEHTPHVPVTPDEVIADAVRCWEAGAAVLHFHARDKDQNPCLDYEFFKEVVAGVRASTDLIVQISTGARIGATREDRIRAIDLAPDMMSLNVGSVNFPRGGVYVNLPADAEYWAAKMLEHRVKPEIECFDLSHIEAGTRLLDMGLIRRPALFNFVLGVKHALSFSPEHLLHMIRSLPRGSNEAMWNVIGIGPAQLKTTALAIVLGGHCRVGIEDNLYYSYKVLATNAQLVERVVRLANELQREVATPAEARAMLGIP
jgi:3-keto-5-aminohexanoate cleavage enzyme